MSSNIKQFGDVIMAMQKGHILHFLLFIIEIRLRMIHILVFIYHLCIIVERKKKQFLLIRCIFFEQLLSLKLFLETVFNMVLISFVVKNGTDQK